MTSKLNLMRIGLGFLNCFIKKSFPKRIIPVRLSSTKCHKSVYLVDEDDNLRSPQKSKINKYTTRTYTCGELRSSNIGERVTLCGWLEYQRLDKFIVLRDSYGEIQLLIKDDDITTQSLIKTVPYESILKVEGTVLARPPNMINKKQQTGEIEISIEKLNILNKADEELPFNIRDFQRAKESLRMQYRYMDLRFPQMQRNLRARSDILMNMRKFLTDNCGFVEVETPTLFKATPGGAQEFVVPTRFPGQFYSLVQSPQQFKQMLMAGAIDRYFQIARCYRDEGSRSDRQPEFTQLDIEMSFTDIPGVIHLIEDLINYSWPSFLNPIPSSFPQITYQQAMEDYGTDKPDTTFGFKLINCIEYFQLVDHKFKKCEDFGVYCLHIPREQSHLSKSVKDKFTKLAETYPDVKLIQNKITSVKDWATKISRLFKEDKIHEFIKDYDVKNDNVIFLAFGSKSDVQSLLGKIRVEYVNLLENMGLRVKDKKMQFLWVTDFPLFEKVTDTDQLNTAHHPFTAPHPEDELMLSSSPLKVRALAYDLVLNGNEVAGGSIRIHDSKLQEKIFEILSIKKDSMSHMLEMLRSGCPPHGGIAIGLDRLLSTLLNTTSIRDVIAFPKTHEGRDPLSGAPSTITEEDKKLYHIKSVE